MSLANTIKFRKNILLSIALASVFAGVSMTSAAFNLSDALKDAAKKQIEQQ